MNIVYRLTSLANKTSDSASERINKSVLILIVLFKAMGCITWVIMYYSLNLTLAYKFPLAYFFLLLLTTIYLYFSKNFDVALYIYIFFIWLVPFLLQVVMGGFINSGAVILWSLLAPLGALFFKGKNAGIIWFGLFLLQAIFSVIFKDNFPHEVTLSEPIINLFFLMNIGVVSGVFFYTLVYFRQLTTQQHHLLELNNAHLAEQKIQSDKLLRNIMPDEVADELKNTGKAKARHFKKVTILFTDFKGFTERCASMNPEEVIEQLNHCFSVFDEIIEKHHLEKIKTIGDAYMCVGGLPIENDTNPADVVSASLEIQAYMENYKQTCISRGERYFECRLGINTGEVVAGVVGKKKFAYDIWGDAVNTASRAESNGIVGKINITESTYELVKDLFQCEYRGEIDTKGKGKLKMYLVSGKTKN